MASEMSLRVGNGVAYALVLISGIIYAVLTAKVLKGLAQALQIVEKGESSSFSYSSAYDLPVWALGFAYIVPGVIGLAAVLTRNKSAYVAAIVFSSLTMLAMAIYFLLMFFLMGVIPLTNPHNCEARKLECVCGSISIPTAGGCDQLAKTFDMSVTALFFNILAFVANLVAFGMTRSTLQGLNASTSGTVKQKYQRHRAKTVPNPNVLEAGFVTPQYPQTDAANDNRGFDQNKT